MGLDIRVASINRDRRSFDEVTVDERSEAANTFYIKAVGIRGALSAHLVTLARRPIAYLFGLGFALRLAGTDLRRVLFSIFYFTEAVILGRWLESQGLPHLHVHFANPAATVGLIMSQIFPIGFSMTVHGPDDFSESQANLLREKIFGASFVCCIGYFARSQLMKLSSPSQWNKFELAPLGVDPNVFMPRPRRTGSAPFEILCIGRLTPSKGQHSLLRAVAHLIAAGRSVRLRLVGDGPDRESLALEIASLGLGRHTVLEGATNQDRIRDFYGSADVFVLPSFAEGIPVVLMEAMAMEIPCVSTFVAGIPELIRDGVEGILVAPSDDHALAGAIQRLIDDSELRLRLGAAGRRRVIEQYNLEANVRRLARIFEARFSADGNTVSRADC